MTDNAGWTAIIPFKPPGQRKTRLAGRLSPAARDRLSETLFERVYAALIAAPMVTGIALLCAEKPPGWNDFWIEDTGHGLNAELRKARSALAASRLMIIHADLPFVTADDIACLSAATAGIAIAPDRHGAGTNAVALVKHPDFAFAFGENSRRAHLTAGSGHACLISRPGLAFDIDTPADLDLAISQGFAF